MTGKRVLLAIAAALFASSSLFAQPVKQPDIVNIKLLDGNPREIDVGPRASVVCRNTAGCSEQLWFMWTGKPPRQPGADENEEKIQVTYRDGLYWKANTPEKVAASECLDPYSFTLDYGAGNRVKVKFKAGNEKCPDKVAFFYMISCKGGKGNDCDGVVALDPGTMADNGRRGP